MDPRLLELWPIWRLVIEKITTLQEIETYWSIEDIMDANELLDAKQEIESILIPKIKGGRDK